jgi:hypothetical protein
LADGGGRSGGVDLYGVEVMGWDGSSTNEDELMMEWVKK